MPISEKTIACGEICHVIDLKLDHQGRLQIADEGSQRSLDGWERRYHDALPWVFEIPSIAGD